MKNGELPAFVPGSVPNNQGNYEPTYGITKREYFAAMAMQGLSTEYWNKNLQTKLASHGADIDRAIAVAAVLMADELLKALES